MPARIPFRHKPMGKTGAFEYPLPRPKRGVPPYTISTIDWYYTRDSNSDFTGSKPVPSAGWGSAARELYHNL